MSMHLEGPWLSTTGKRKAKHKYASAEHKKAALEQAAEWAQKTAEFKRLSSPTPPRASKGTLRTLPRVPVGRDTPTIASKVTVWGPCVKPEDKVYTGSAIKGIGTMHKSNAVPIFSDQEAVEISQMRRG